MDSAITAGLIKAGIEFAGKAVDKACDAFKHHDNCKVVMNRDNNIRDGVIAVLITGTVAFLGNKVLSR